MIVVVRVNIPKVWKREGWFFFQTIKEAKITQRPKNGFKLHVASLHFFFLEYLSVFMRVSMLYSHKQTIWAISKTSLSGQTERPTDRQTQHVLACVQS